MRRLLLAALLLIAPTALADEQDDTEREVEEAIRMLTQPQGEMAPADLEALAKQILEKMAGVRELPIKGKVTMEVATREQIVSYVDSRIQEEMKGETLVGQEAALKRLGLVPESLDMKKFLLDLYGEQVAGYYDPFKGKFFIASWMQPAMQAPIMAHELTHALQDQHFNLKPFLTPLPDNSDATSARQAVVEGDAVIAMFGFLGMPVSDRIGPTLRSSMASPTYPVFQGAPAYFQEALFFPYADGADFIVEAHAKGGWKRVSALYADLPKSSEQILHPEKYLGETRDEPTAVDIPMTLTGWKEVHHDVLGEIVLRVMLEGWAGASDAKKAAAGWDGDRYRAFQKNGSRGGWRSTMIVHRSTWDSTSDAKEFADVLKKALQKKYESKDMKIAKGVAKLSTSIGVTTVEVRGSDVVWVDGAPDAEMAGKVAKLAWGSK